MKQQAQVQLAQWLGMADEMANGRNMYNTVKPAILYSTNWPSLVWGMLVCRSACPDQTRPDIDLNWTWTLGAAQSSIAVESREYRGRQGVILNA